MQKEINPKELRFLAKMVSDNPDNRDREFSIIFSLVDDDIKVWENQSNGFDGGFVFKSAHDRKRGTPEFAKMYIGSKLKINGVEYELTSAPECTFDAMEKDPIKYPQMNVEIILRKLKPYKGKLETDFEKCLIPETDRIKLEDATDVLEKCEANLNKNEVIAIVRKYRFYKTKTFLFNQLLLALE